MDAPILPLRVPFEPDFALGHPALDAQHRALLALCDRLADHALAAEDAAGPRHFDETLAQLRTLARDHFDTEATVLAARGDPDHDDARLDGAEFEDLAADIVTTEHFDRVELQRFLALWWLGHLRGTVACVADWRRVGLTARAVGPRSAVFAFAQTDRRRAVRLGAGSRREPPPETPMDLPHLRPTFWLVPAVLLLAGMAGCSPRPVPVASGPAASAAAGQVSDVDVTEHVRTALLQAPSLKGADITVITLKGDVRLVGMLDSRAQVDEALRVARAADGAHAIHDELTVRP